KAHQAIEEYFTQVSESKLLGKPGLQELRKELLETALRYYQDFLSQRADDPTLQAEVAAALGRVAFIYDQTGAPDAARTAYQQALARYERLAEAEPANPKLQADLARTCTRLAGVQARTRALDEAVVVLDRARAIQERLAADDPTQEHRNDVARTYRQTGHVWMHQGRRPEARRALVQARDTWQQLVQAHPDRADFRHD